MSVLGLGERTKTYDLSCPRAKCQKNSGPVTKKHGGQCRKKTWTGQAHSSFFDIPVFPQAMFQHLDANYGPSFPQSIFQHLEAKYD